MNEMPIYQLRDGTVTFNLTKYIIDLVGSRNNLAKLLGVARSTIQGYEERGYPAPMYACDIEEITKKKVTTKMVCDIAKSARRS